MLCLNVVLEGWFMADLGRSFHSLIVLGKKELSNGASLVV